MLTFSKGLVLSGRENQKKVITEKKYCLTAFFYLQNMNFTEPLTPSPKIIIPQLLIDVNNLLALCLARRCHLIPSAPGIWFICDPLPF